MFIRQAFTTFAVLHSEALSPALERVRREEAPNRGTAEEPALPPRDWVIDWRWLAD